MHVITKGTTMCFNPDDFFSTTTVKDIASAFPHLEALDFTTCSLNDELVKLNYEITSSEYRDFLYANLKDYYHFEVDTIV
jgi:hypothetical protein